MTHLVDGICRNVCAKGGYTLANYCISLTIKNLKTSSDFVRVLCVLNLPQCQAFTFIPCTASTLIDYEFRCIATISVSQDMTFPDALCFQIYRILDDMIMLLCVFHMQNDQYNGHILYFHENGKLCDKVIYANGKQHGYWQFFHKNGQLRAKGNYINGKQHGCWQFFYDTGQLKKESTYLNGIKS